MATRAIDKGMPIEQVQKILGHSQIDTTMQYAMVKSKVVLKERDAWKNLANFIGEMVAKYAEAMNLDNLSDPNFNRVQFESVRSEAGLNRFVMTPTKWIEQTKGIDGCCFSRDIWL